MRDKDAVKRELLDFFRAANAGVGALLPPKWLQRHYLPTFGDDEQGAFEDAVNELVSGGLLEHAQRGTPNLRLTARGAAYIYTTSRDAGTQFE